MELIEVGGFKDGVAVATEVAVALVVGDDDNHIRRLRSRRRRWQIEDKRCKSDEVVFHGGVLFFGGDSFDELFEQVGPIGGKVFAFDTHTESVAALWVDVEFARDFHFGGCLGEHGAVV